MVIARPPIGSHSLELFWVKGNFLCCSFPLARWPKLNKTKFPETDLQISDKIQVLIISDTCGDLPNTRSEARKLYRELKSSPFGEKLDIEITEPGEDPFSIRCKLRNCDFLHYSGHCVFQETYGDMSKTGWLLEGKIDHPELGDILSAGELEKIWRDKAPLLVFANACDSGKSSPEGLKRISFSDASMGFAQVCLAAGVSTYVGTVWAAPDVDATIDFAVEVYRKFLTGHTIGHAVLEARNSCVARYGKMDLTWARYALFGDPLTHISFKKQSTIER
ncbi:MAG: CHAT domain-containing protein [Methanobacteriota archaeon]|nr:MAG: CHAT domain-containing protein [Euryarchaeota archaeon]